MDDFVFVSEAKADELRPNNAFPGDIVFTQRGTIGQVGLIPHDSPYPRFVISQSQMKLTPDAAKVDAEFLYFLFRAPRTVKKLTDLAFAAGVPHINLDILRRFEISIPTLSVQRRIAAILSDYEDLIANNVRRIQILEKMAASIYREWFVHFRFPGHEAVAMVESLLGPIPEGWMIRSLGECCVLTMGQSPPSRTYNTIGEGLPFHQGVRDFGPRFPLTRLYCTQDGRQADARDILFSVRAPVGRMNFADRRIVIGRGLCAIRAIDGSQAFLWEQLRNRFTEEDMIGNGAIFAAVTKTEMERLSLLWPAKELLAHAATLLEPLHELVRVLFEEVEGLRVTRDLLLPRLMSGRLTLPHAERLASATL
jgi:type I restriction enzyme S subunit